MNDVNIRYKKIKNTSKWYNIMVTETIISIIIIIISITIENYWFIN